MRRMSMATRREMTAAVAQRYKKAERAEKMRLLDEFVLVSGFHRKHAMRLLRANVDERPVARRTRRRVYDEPVRSALILLWEASDRVCGKRLKPLLPLLLEAMQRHGHLSPAPEIKTELLAMSAATIDRALRPVREKANLGAARRRASTALRRSVPVRTFADWQDPQPGFVEADLVAHSGPSSRGGFLYTLVLTDVATGWTECAPLLVREQKLLSEVLTELRKQLPFPLLGLDTDNDTVFLNETIKAYCEEIGVVFTRCRPYRKNDQAFVEQKNGAIVRRMVGYRRFEGLAAAATLAQLYRAARLFVNFFQPSFKLLSKEREGALVRKRYDAPMTPHQRLLADARLPEAARERLQATYVGLDPIGLLREIRTCQKRLVDLADVSAPAPEKTAPLPIEQFLSGLRLAWKDGQARPTDQAKPKPKRERRRPDPLVAITPQLRDWFIAEPWRSGGELLAKLQAEYPGAYPASLLRTLQRRLKMWRSERAHELLFGSARDQPLTQDASQPLTPAKQS